MYVADELLYFATPQSCFFNVDQTRIARDALMQ